MAAPRNIEEVRESMKSRFESNHLHRFLAKKEDAFFSKRFSIMSKRQYEEMISELDRIEKEGLITQTWNKNQYNKELRISKRFCFKKIGGVSRVLSAPSSDESQRIYLHSEELFDKLWESHHAMGHKGRDKMIQDLNRIYANISREIIQAFIFCCEACTMKKKKTRKHLVVRPLVSPEMNSRGQVDLIDFQSQADNDYKYIMVYQDHLTKFVHLRPLKRKTAAEVGRHLFEIFGMIGAPHILQSDNGREFANSVITCLADMWVDCKIVHGKPRHSQSQGSVERANQDVEEMIAAYLHDHKTNRWASILPIIQFRKNNTPHRGIGRSPYKAMFGVDAKLGIKETARIPSAVIPVLESEEDLERILNETDAELNHSFEEEDTIARGQEVKELGGQSKRLAAEAFGNEIDDEPASCITCGLRIHESENGMPWCRYCANSQRIVEQRTQARATQQLGAEKMVEKSRLQMKAAELGENVVVAVPMFDKGRGDFRNVLGTVLSINDGMYEIGTRAGKLDKLFVRSEFEISKQVFIVREDVPPNACSLREAARKESNGTGQGFFRCLCKRGCGTKICKCKSSGRSCSSFCHGSGVCKNK